MGKRNKSAAEICKLFEISEATLNRHVANGLANDKTRQRGQPRRFDADEVRAFIDRAKQTGNPSRAGESLSDEMVKVKVAKEREITERYKVANDREDATLMNADEEQKRQGKILAFMETKLATLPAIIAAATQGLSGADAHAAFDAAIERTLKEIAAA